MKKRLGYQHKVALLIILFAIVPIFLLSAFYYNYSIERWEKTLLAEPRQTLAASANFIDKTLVQNSQKAEHILTNQKVRSYVSNANHTSLLETLTFVDYFQELITLLQVDNQKIHITLYDLQNNKNLGDYYKGSDTLRVWAAENEQLMDKILTMPEEEELWELQTVSPRDGLKKDFLCLYRTMYLYGKPIAFVELAIPTDSFALESIDAPSLMPSLSAIVSEQHALAINNTYPLLPEEEKTLEAYLKKKDTSNVQVLQHSIPQLNGEMVYLIPNTYINAQLRQNKIIFFFLLLLIILGLFASIELVSFFFTRKITAMISKMSEDLDEIIENDTLNDDSQHEDFLQIGEKIGELIQQTKRTTTQLQQYEIDMAKLELELLHMRFNPHFLYNTLGTIRAIVPNKSIKSSIDSMINYYRIVLNQGHVLIAIEKEIALIEEYVRLQEFSYMLDFDFIVDVFPEAASYTMVKHLLQPIVENALFHGIRCTEQGVLILRASLSAENHRIIFEVIDNGPGMSEEEVHLLLSGNEKNKTQGYGMYNVQRRIQLYYGEEYGITIQSKKNKGTCVRINIPAIIEEVDS